MIYSDYELVKMSVLDDLEVSLKNMRAKNITRNNNDYIINFMKNSYIIDLEVLEVNKIYVKMINNKTHRVECENFYNMKELTKFILRLDMLV